eukprot:RCo044011
MHLMTTKKKVSAKADVIQSVYWLKTDVFEQGTLPVVFPSSYTLSSLLKVAPSPESTKLSCDEWVSSCQKWLGVSSELALALFDTFLSLTLEPASQLESTRDELYSRQNGVHESFLALREVPLPSFLLFLALQLCPRSCSPLASPRHDGVW